MKKAVTLLVSIVERGQGKKIISKYSGYEVTCHFQLAGRGTASSDLLDLLGLGGPERDVVLSFGEYGRIQKLLYDIQEDELELHAKGIACSMDLTALNTLAAAMLMSGSSEDTGGGMSQQGQSIEGGMTMQQKEQEAHSLILIVVNQGHTDEVMNTARSAGARGGTILRSRWAGDQDSQQFYGITLQAEKEIIAIATVGEQRKLIMETVNKKHGMHTEAGVIICSVAVDQMVRLS